MPEQLDRWQALAFAVMDGTGDKKLQAVRDGLVDAPAVMRVYGGPTPRERLLVVRVLGTTYVRAEVLPWTIGK